MEDNRLISNKETTERTESNNKLQQDNQDKPVLVVKYNKKKVIGWIVFFYFFVFIIPLIFFYTQQPDENYYEYLFIKIGTWVFAFLGIHLWFDILNNDKFEIYDNKIEKKVKFFKNLPILGDKIIYLDTAYYKNRGFGILLCNCKLFLSYRGIDFLIPLLSNDDRLKASEFLHRVSGRKKWKFLELGLFSLFAKKFKTKLDIF